MQCSNLYFPDSKNPCFYVGKGSGRSPGGGDGNPFSIIAWRIPWAEEPGYSPQGRKELGTDEAT